MASHNTNLTAARDIADDYSGVNENVYQAAVRLQLAILAAMTAELRNALPKRIKLVDGLTPDEAKMAGEANKKISAIKAVRERTGLGLKGSKDLVESWMEKNLGFRYWPSNENIHKPAYDEPTY